MKISKLFHWLYAILMLLPVFAIGVTCAYAIFNKNAYQSFETKEVQNYTKITETSQIIENKDYMFSFESNFTQQTDYIYFNSIDNWVKNLEPNVTLVAFRLTGTSNFILRDSNNNDYSRYGFFTNATQQFKTFNFNFKSSSNLQYMKNINSFYLISYVIKPISDVFYYSIDKVQQSPLFNWAYDSFLATPITYITGLFGIASDHITVMLMSYWLAISVIWLVFDMVMYVPLLVHRWIDKGVLE